MSVSSHACTESQLFCTPSINHRSQLMAEPADALADCAKRYDMVAVAPQCDSDSDVHLTAWLKIQQAHREFTIFYCPSLADSLCLHTSCHSNAPAVVCCEVPSLPAVVVAAKSTLHVPESLIVSPRTAVNSHPLPAIDFYVAHEEPEIDLCPLGVRIGDSHATISILVDAESTYNGALHLAVDSDQSESDVDTSHEPLTLADDSTEPLTDSSSFSLASEDSGIDLERQASHPSASDVIASVAATKDYDIPPRPLARSVACSQLVRLCGLASVDQFDFFEYGLEYQEAQWLQSWMHISS